MAVLPIVRMGHPVLRTVAGEVPLERLAEPATQRWIDDMVETMHEADGVGLAAPDGHAAMRRRLTVGQVEDPDPRPLFLEQEDGATCSQFGVIGMRGDHQVIDGWHASLLGAGVDGSPLRGPKETEGNAGSRRT